MDGLVSLKTLLLTYYVLSKFLHDHLNESSIKKEKFRYLH